MKEFKRIAACFMAVIWAAALLHCVADKATAHWHKHEGKQTHHHHHDHSDTHEHKLPSDPWDGESHGTGDPSCCGLQTSLRSHVNLSLEESAPLVSSIGVFAKALYWKVAPEDPSTAHFSHSDPPDLLQYSYRFVASLVAPNAPPRSTHV